MAAGQRRGGGGQPGRGGTLGADRDRARGRPAGRGHDAEGRLLAKQGAQHRIVGAVAAAAADEAATDGQARQRQVAHCVQQLVAYELVREAQAFGVQDAVA